MAGYSSAAGKILGGIAGAGLGTQIGSGSGTDWAMIVGGAVGAIVGGIIEAETSTRPGLEYTIVLESGVVMTVVQEISEDGVMPAVGERVMVQNASGYQRVLTAEHMPSQVDQPEGVDVIATN